MRDSSSSNSALSTKHYYVAYVSASKAKGDGTVLGGLATPFGANDGRPFFIDIHGADIWAKRNGQWLVVYTRATRATVQPSQ